MKRLLAKFSGLDRVQKILARDPSQDALSFIENSTVEFGLETKVIDLPTEKLRSTVFFCTHHTGAVDFMAAYPPLFQLSEDLKIVANRELLNLKPVAPILIPVNTLSSGKSNPLARHQISEHLKSGGNILVYPAGRVGTDLPWEKTAIAQILKAHGKFAVPVLIDAENGRVFNFIRGAFPKLSLLFFLSALNFRAKKPVNVYFGEPIGTDRFQDLEAKSILKLIRDKTYSLKYNHNRRSDLI